MIKAKDSIYKITPYVGGESGGKEGQRIIKLSSNEGPFGPPPMAVEAMKLASENAHRYPDGGCNELRGALAAKNNINADNIVCGAGSDEIIALLCKAYTGEGDEVLYTEHSFLMYAISAKAAGATPVTAPEKDLTTDVDALLAKVTDKTKLVFVANPNNPTASYIKRDEIERLHAGLPDDVLLIIDAAYTEYVDDPDYTDGHDLVERHNNVVVTRTFSKLYGLGGIRLGWCHAPAHVIDVMNRVRGPFNVSIEAQAAGVAALQDDAFVEKSLSHNKQCRTKFVTALEGLGIKVYPSACNFILAELEDAKRAEDLRLALKDEGVFIRQMGGYGLPTCLRITIGTEEEMDIALQAITTYIHKCNE